MAAGRSGGQGRRRKRLPHGRILQNGPTFRNMRSQSTRERIPRGYSRTVSVLWSLLKELVRVVIRDWARDGF